MMYLTWLDSNTWLVEIAGQQLLLDPWLVGPLTFGQADWLFKATRIHDRPIPDAIDLILLSQGLPDHAHVPTLKTLDRQIPVVGSAKAAKVAQSLGYTQVTALAPGETHLVAERLEIRATRGALVGPTAVENGYVLCDRTQGETLYYEPHGFNDPDIQNLAPIDVVITPIVDMKLPLLGPIIRGKQSAQELAQWLHPQVLLPTAAGGDIQMTGLLDRLLTFEGSADELRQTLATQGSRTQVLEPTPGERLAVPLTTPVGS